ncbi:hypothetical protein [Alteromonas portus]|uniref:hypothetical protein n=1 Tax=Alteromonas portus TaxID=2565549 RepID=UPI003BF85CA5
MRVSHVLLAVILPALFSSLVSVSVLGEGRSVQNMAGQSKSAAALSTLMSEWESSAFEVSDDDIDDGIPFFNTINGSEKYRFSAGKAVDAKAVVRQRANIIRGPPSFT